MGFSTSINIERDFGKTPNYIVTANAKQAIGKIINHFSTGIHSFCLIGSYGTGKSSFVLALENSLRGVITGDNLLLKSDGQFNGFKKFSFLNIVGDYTSLSSLLVQYLKTEERNIFETLDKYYKSLQTREEFLVIAIDEFGKVLEHAAKNNPEKEMYFLQKFCEYVNDTDKNILFLSTLHQGFNAYSKGLKLEQKQEWIKVKGRIQDIIFNEPIEQLLNLTATRLSSLCKVVNKERNESVNILYNLALQSKFTNNKLNSDVVDAIYPMDIFAAYILTQANQKYGQNERTLFTFLESKGEGSLRDFKVEKNRLYNLADVYDYIVYNFYSHLQEVNEDSAKWSAIKIAIERTEGLILEGSEIEEAVKLVKIIGLLNIFASSATVIDKEFIVTYARNAMAITDIGFILDRLEKAQILRFAKYKSKYILFEGTDVNIEAGLFEAMRECKRPTVIADKLNNYFQAKVSLANAHYFKTGTPRYFKYSLTGKPIDKVSYGEIDGYVNLLFTPIQEIEATKQKCLEIKGQAILYCIFKNTQNVIDHLFEIDKLNWVRDYYVADNADIVAQKEIANLIKHEQSILNNVVLNSIFTDEVVWVFNGEVLPSITSQKQLAKELSAICDKIYWGTPKYKFELINKFKPTGNMSLARQMFLMAILEKSGIEDCGFEKDKYPPEKSIYLTLVKKTGIHTTQGLGKPTEDTFLPMWNACEDFLNSTINKPRRLSEFYNMLATSPFRLKQGLIDCWLPTFLIIKKDDFALYNNEVYVPQINKEVLDLILRSPGSYSIKAFSVDGVKKSFFDKYRQAINLGTTEIKTDSFIETIRPFLVFYRKLNNYAKRTKDISVNARKFRDVIATAIDPEKTFFELLPDALGFKEITLSQNPDLIESFVSVIQDAIRDLRSCYDELINVIEANILKSLHISEKDFSSYHAQIVSRYKNVKVELMPLNVRNFHSRLVGKYDNKKGWIEAISYIVLNKPLTEIKDIEKVVLVSSIEDMLFQLDDYVEMHKQSEESVVRLHITQNNAKALTSQVVVSKEMEQNVKDLEEKIESFLSNNDSVNLAALIGIIKKKLI